MPTFNRNITEKAVKAVGNVSEVSRRFGFKSTQSVANWILNNRTPAERVIPLCAMGGWEFSPHSLRPDLYPNPNDGMPAGIQGEGGRK